MASVKLFRFKILSECSFTLNIHKYPNILCENTSKLTKETANGSAATKQLSYASKLNSTYYSNGHLLSSAFATLFGLIWFPGWANRECLSCLRFENICLEPNKYTEHIYGKNSISNVRVKCFYEKVRKDISLETSSNSVRLTMQELNVLLSPSHPPSTSTTSACVMTSPCNVCQATMLDDQNSCTWQVLHRKQWLFGITWHRINAQREWMSAEQKWFWTQSLAFHNHPMQFVLIALQRLCSIRHSFAMAKASWSITSTWQKWWRRKMYLAFLHSSYWFQICALSIPVLCRYSTSTSACSSRGPETMPSSNGAWL